MYMDDSLMAISMLVPAFAALPVAVMLVPAEEKPGTIKIPFESSSQIHNDISCLTSPHSFQYLLSLPQFGL